MVHHIPGLFEVDKRECEKYRMHVINNMRVMLLWGWYNARTRRILNATNTADAHRKNARKTTQEGSPSLYTLDLTLSQNHAIQILLARFRSITGKITLGIGILSRLGDASLPAQ